MALFLNGPPQVGSLQILRSDINDSALNLSNLAVRLQGLIDSNTTTNDNQDLSMERLLQLSLAKPWVSSVAT